MKTKEQYLREMNRLGRFGVLTTLILLFAVPLIFGLYHNAMPTIADFFKAGSGVLILYIPIGIIEVLSYSPILGSASYITFITGNIMNLKIPIATNAQELASTTKGTEKSDVITTLAIGVSSMVTIIMIAVGVLLLVPLESLMTSDVAVTASGYILPALFGALIIGLMKSSGDIQVKGKMKAGVLPFFILLIINLFIYKTELISGVLLIITIPFTILCAYVLFKIGQIKIIVKENKEGTE